MEALLYCMIAASDSDSAAVLAEMVSGSQEAFVAKMNQRAAEMGCTSTNFTNAHGLYDENAYSSAAADARMAGSTLPVMSTAGSGNQGISASLPVVAAARKLGVGEDAMLRAEALSQLITIHIKSHIGKLSPLCGCAIASSIGSSAGIVYLLGGGIDKIHSAIQNMIADISGLICDVAKSSCALKIASSLASAVQCAQLAMAGVTATALDGIIAQDTEDSICNLANLGSVGMNQTDRVILDMMIAK